MCIKLTIVLLLGLFVVLMAFLVVSSEDSDKSDKKNKDRRLQLPDELSDLF
jgi:hypothetical protein